MAWKAFFRTWSRQSRAAGPGAMRQQLACLSWSAYPVLLPLL